jgi:hypothetical protein
MCFSAKVRILLRHRMLHTYIRFPRQGNYDFLSSPIPPHRFRLSWESPSFARLGLSLSLPQIEHDAPQKSFYLPVVTVRLSAARCQENLSRRCNALTRHCLTIGCAWLRHYWWLFVTRLSASCDALSSHARFFNYSLRAADGIRTRDFHVGNVTL